MITLLGMNGRVLLLDSKEKEETRRKKVAASVRQPKIDPALTGDQTVDLSKWIRTYPDGVCWRAYWRQGKTIDD